MDFVTSDLHFGHKNIVKFKNSPRTTYYKSENLLKTMEEDLINLWNEEVTEADNVYVLGDLSFYNMSKTKEIIRQLNGHIMLVPGNHDMNGWLRQSVYGVNNLTILPSIVNYKFKEEDEKYRAVLCHYPIEEWEGKDHGAVHLHGHTHKKKDENVFESRRFDVGIDGTYPTPGLYEMKKLIKTLYENPLPTPRWEGRQ